MQSTENSDEQGEIPTTIRLGFVPGVIPTKWVRIWRERHPDKPLELIALGARDRGRAAHTDEVDVALVRPPLISRSLSSVVLYEEISVVVFPKDHHFAAADTLVAADLAQEIQLNPQDCAFDWWQPELPDAALSTPAPPSNPAPATDQAPTGNSGASPAAGLAPRRPGSMDLLGLPAKQRPQDTAEAIALVAAGIGIVVIPQSLARLHHRKDLTFLPLEQGPTAPIALVWRGDDASELVEEFHGIVRGRTANSTRGVNNQPLEGKAAKALKAQRIADKNARRAAEFAAKSGSKSGTKAGSKAGTKATGKSGAKSGPKGGSKVSPKTKGQPGTNRGTKGRKPPRSS